MTQAGTKNAERISRRQVDKFAERREELAESALQTLAELGYARTSLREIAQNSAFSHGVLHYYFNDKIDLITHCVRRYKAVCVTRYDEVVDRATTPLQLELGFAAALAQTLRADCTMHRLWYDLRSQALFETALRDDVAQIDASLEHMIWRVVSRYSSLAGADIAVSAPVAYALFDGMFQQALLHHLAGDESAAATLEEQARDVLRTVVLRRAAIGTGADEAAGVTAAAHVLTLPAAVDVREVGPRDGLQLEALVPLDAKLAMLAALAETGVHRIEATAFVSPRAVPAMADAPLVAAELYQWPHIRWSALVPNLKGAQLAIEAGFTDLEFVISAADGHSLANAGMTTDAALALVEPITALVHAAGGHCEVIIATAWDCPFDGRTPVGRTAEVARRAVEAGADQLCLGDTIGTTTPVRVVTLLEAVRSAAAGLPVGVHFHDTRGTGQANVLAAVQAGVTQLDASVGGLGGCPFAPGASGNIATEELVYMLSESGVETGISLDALLVAARRTEEAVGHELPSSLYRAGGAAVALGRGALAGL